MAPASDWRAARSPADESWMKRLWPILLLLAGGCLSNAPVVTFLDLVAPGKLRSSPRVQPHGGVCIPQGTLGGPPIPPPPVLPPPVAVPSATAPSVSIPPPPLPAP